MIVQYHQKATLKQLCEWMSLPRSSYYYKPAGERRDLKPSTQTLKADETVVPNTELADTIKSILSGECVCYDYQKVVMQLKQKK